MKIVWLSWKDRYHPTAGGAEAVAHQLMSRLVSSGHQVTLLTSNYYDQVAGRIADTDTMTADGYRIVRTGNRFTTYLTTAWYYYRHRSELAADIVIDECNTVAYFARFYSRTRTVQLFHQLARQIWFYELPPPLSLVGYLVEPLYLRLLAGSREVITVSASTKADLMRYGFKPSAIHVISEGLPMAPVPDLSAVSKYPHPTLLSHGAVRPMKRTLHQLEAFELAKARIPDLRLIISGELAGRYGQKLVRQVAASPYRDHIKLLGRTTDADKTELMRRCHLILVTSIKEGWGLIVSEAASQGTPAVVYDVDGLRDAVNLGTVGYLTSTNNPQALVQQIVAAFSDDAAYQAKRLAAWSFVKPLTFENAYQDFCQALKIPYT